MPAVMHPVMMGDVAVVVVRPEPMRPEMARPHSMEAPCACMESSEAAEVTTASAARLGPGLRSERCNQDRGRNDDYPSKHVCDPAAGRVPDGHWSENIP
jgi:hypothetical protein